jgi:hypothetical protein
MKYYGICKVRDKKTINIFYRIAEENKTPVIFLTHMDVKGNKKGGINLALLKSDKRIGLYMLDYIDDSMVPSRGWTNLNEKKFVGYLKKGILSEEARKALFKIFGDKYFGLTKMEREYFSKNFATPERLLAFYKVARKEMTYSGWYYGSHPGEITRDFDGKTIIITTTKIRKAARELFNVELDDIMKAP